jgi:lipopolysaccharide/colanic/teichoic acid biosynthesis glycosyltransferase
MERILPEKIRLSKEYVRHASPAIDVKVLLRTMGAVIRPGGSS